MCNYVDSVEILCYNSWDGNNNWNHNEIIKIT